MFSMQNTNDKEEIGGMEYDSHKKPQSLYNSVHPIDKQEQYVTWKYSRKQKSNKIQYK
jgi:hypothetical protein